MKKLALFVAMASLGLATVIHADDDATASGKIRMIVGNDVATSDEDYANGSNWLALDCVAKGCQLLPAKLQINPGQGGMHLLHFSLVKGDAAHVQAWLRVDAARPWIKPGPLVTYVSGETDIKHPVGDMSVAIPTPGHQAMLVGLLDRSRETVMLQLREPATRQMLDALTTCASPGDTSWLRWAGDIDGDGKPDYLIVYPRSDNGVHAVLYLSSVTAAGQLVGEAAVFDSSLAFSRCSGEEWSLTR
ncbi:hypothetical protein EC912_102757 [Luteibacter rhizovicinus]|uniref:FG-GAP repeat protein n=1 Tax=Luteibacter rhizovicinus TaxID=242606 RepID=A0A4R3YVD2_9GAMM|nr:hypothetical protein [Luteibacter rhizovicinus]TCV96406.1 hypothetical protein EC912_102757 [Luteibacter rhizovicinus]